MYDASLSWSSVDFGSKNWLRSPYCFNSSLIHLTCSPLDAFSKGFPRNFSPFTILSRFQLIRPLFVPAPSFKTQGVLCPFHPDSACIFPARIEAASIGKPSAINNLAPPTASVAFPPPPISPPISCPGDTFFSSTGSFNINCFCKSLIAASTFDEIFSSKDFAITFVVSSPPKIPASTFPPPAYPAVPLKVFCIHPVNSSAAFI